MTVEESNKYKFFFFQKKKKNLYLLLSWKVFPHTHNVGLSLSLITIQVKKLCDLNGVFLTLLSNIYHIYDFFLGILRFLFSLENIKNITHFTT